MFSNDDSRIHKINIKVSALEREELNRIVAEEELSLSDILRKAIRNTYDVEGFDPSYNKSIFTPTRKSIF